MPRLVGPHGPVPDERCVGAPSDAPEAGKPSRASSELVAAMRVGVASTLFLCLLFAAVAGAYKETDHLDSTLSTHQYMMDFLPASLERDGHAEFAARLRAGWLDQLKRGSIESDRYLVRQGSHYMSPITHAGLPGFMAAGDYADAHVAAAAALWIGGDEADAILQIG